MKSMPTRSNLLSSSAILEIPTALSDRRRQVAEMCAQSATRQVIEVDAPRFSPHEYARFPREDSTGHQFGVELEVEFNSRGRRDQYETATGLFPEWYMYAKSDGSLSYSGVEIVTRPDAMHVHKRIFSEVMPEVRKYFRGWNGYNCGMHVHVGRSTLTKLQIAKMVMFINAPENTAMVKFIAGRSSSEWSRIQKKCWGEFNVDNRYPLGTKMHIGRYQAINLCNDKTIEFRIFRSTTKLESFLKNLEFVEAVTNYCGMCNSSTADIEKLEPFLEYVKSRKMDYPNLYTKLTERFYTCAS